MKHSAEFEALVNDARTRIQEVSIDEVRQALEAGATFQLIDVREDREWAACHIPGAKHMGKGVIERDIVGAVPDKAAPLVLYCGGGYRSALAADNLQKMGYTNVKSMDGGFRGWTAAGAPVVQP